MTEHCPVPLTFCVDPVSVEVGQNWVRTGRAVSGSGETPRCQTRGGRTRGPPDKQIQTPAAPSWADGSPPLFAASTNQWSKKYCKHV